MKTSSWIAAAALVLAGAVTAPASAQSQAQPQVQPQARANPFILGTPSGVKADPADVGSIDSIIAAVYGVISGPAGQRRDWDRMRSLFTAGARLMPRDPSGLRIGGVEDYIATSGPFLEGGGFFEREIGRVTEQYGDIAHVFSSYEARRTSDGPIFMRGINSLQLVRHGGRWWVTSIMWQAETPATPIPKRYLKRRKR
jgi:hypothetical protein